MSEVKNILIIHNVRSSENVGSMFRTADAAGIEKIYLTGYSPAPIDRFGRLNKKLNKTSLGAEQVLSWEKRKNVSNVFMKLKKDNFKIVALEQDSRAIDYRCIKIKNQSAFIVGNEVSGLSKSLLKKVDQIAEIPMSGEKESLNVSVALGVFLFRVLN